jgi:hypothetical protein
MAMDARAWQATINQALFDKFLFMATKKVVFV